MLTDRFVTHLLSKILFSWLDSEATSKRGECAYSVCGNLYFKRRKVQVHKIYIPQWNLDEKSFQAYRYLYSR